MILANKIWAPTIVVVVVVVLSLRTTLCQVSDGDDQFQVFHQDIGRISGAPSSNSPVAPQTIVKQVVQQAPTAAPLQPTSTTRARHQSHNNQQQHQNQQRKPNRVTLAVRTQIPISVVVEPEAAAAAAFELQPMSAPALTESTASTSTFTSATSQLAAPPQYQSFAPFQAQHSPTAATTLVDNNNHHHHHQQQPAGPALSSFRSSLSNSVTARHTALMAQVAAERQAAAALMEPDFTTNTQNQNHNHQQPSLGSPIEALSSPSIAQVQAPANLHQLAAGSSSNQAAASVASPNFVNQPEEPIVAPSFEHVLGHGCPHKGVFSYENKDHCDRYYMCTNGTFTEEACPNGLAYSQMGAVYQHCAYNWNVDCGAKKTSEPLASPGCPWQFGIFPTSSSGRCSIDYFVCEWGVPETKRCTPEGLFYDDRIKGCQWADQLGCKSEALLNFKCPEKDEDNPYWPYPRYYHTKQDIVVCVNDQPRLVHCNEEQVVEASSLACMDLNKKKKKKKF